MKCPNCKTENPPDEKFCWRCHIPLEQVGQKWAGHAAMVKGRRRILRLLVVVAVGAVLAFSVLQITYRRSPAGVVEAFTKAREQGDFRSMYMLLTKDSQTKLKGEGVRDIWPEQPNMRYKFGVMDWLGKGDVAAVRIVVQKESKGGEKQRGEPVGPQQQVMRLVKESGRWRIDLTGAGRS